MKFYFKLPSWFKIPTPIGNYNPDWALVLERKGKEKKADFIERWGEAKYNQIYGKW